LGEKTWALSPKDHRFQVQTRLDLATNGLTGIFVKVQARESARSTGRNGFGLVLFGEISGLMANIQQSITGIDKGFWLWYGKILHDS